MARFQKFQWIPMIVKAYNEAKQRSQGPSPNVPSVTRMTLSDDVPASTPRHPIELHKAKEPTSQAKSTPPARRALITQKRNVRTPGQKKAQDGATAFPDSPHYKQMLRELREAKAKLSQLESIHQQLTLIQSQIDSQFSELMTRVQAQDSTRKLSSDTDDETPASPATTPAVTKSTQGGM